MKNEESITKGANFTVTGANKINKEYVAASFPENLKISSFMFHGLLPLRSQEVLACVTPI